MAHMVNFSYHKRICQLNIISFNSKTDDLTFYNVCKCVYHTKGGQSFVISIH